MIALLKYLGKGLLTILLLPFIVLGIAIIFVYEIIHYLIRGFIAIIYFFRGKNAKCKDDETILYEEALELESKRLENNQLISNPVTVENPMENIPTMEDVQEEPEIEIQEVQEQESEVEENE